MKVKFSVTSSATKQSVFVARTSQTTQGQFVPLKSKDGVRSGSVDLTPGDYVFTVVLSGGQPESDFSVSVRRGPDDDDPLEVEDTLNEEGKGGCVDFFTVE